MPADKPTELSRIKLKTWTRQPVPMISKHSAHSTLLPIGFRTWLWRYTCLLLLTSMLWHRQAIFESKGDKLSSSAEGRIRTQGLRYLFTSRLNACWQTGWAIEDQAKNLNSTARPYDQQAFSPLDLTANWLSHLALEITQTCMRIDVNDILHKQYIWLWKYARNANFYVLYTGSFNCLPSLAWPFSTTWTLTCFWWPDLQSFPELRCHF